MKIATLTMALGLTATLLGGCCKKKEEAPTGDAVPPPASATAMTTTTATAPVTTTVPVPTLVPPPTATVAPKPVDNAADAGAIRSCCAAIRRAAGSEKSPSDKAKLNATAGACDSQVGNVQRGTVTRASALTVIRANNGGKPLPSGCN